MIFSFLNTWILDPLHCVRFHILVRCNRVIVKNIFLRIFVRCSLYNFLSEIVLIEPFTVEFYYLINCIPMSTNRFTLCCDYFQSQSEIFFYFLSISWTNKSKCQNVNGRLYHEYIFMKQDFSGSLSSAPPPPHPPPPPPKKNFPVRLWPNLLF